MAAVVKEEPEASYSLSLLLGDRNPRCRAMTASAVGGAPTPAQHQHNLHPQAHAPLHQQQQQNCNSQQLPQHNNQHQPQTHQPLMNGGPFERAPAHSPSTMPPAEPTKRHPSPNKPPANDPLSHRIIEKRRRDRMNNCLADLSRLIPTYYLKKGRGRIEKTEIIEMAIKYMKHLQAHACSQIENCEVTAKQERTGNQLEQFHLGYQECMSETMQFLVESEGFFSGDSLCVRLMNHLTKHCEKILTSEGYVTRQSGASSSTSSGYHANSSSAGSSSDGNGNGSSHASESKDTLVTEESAYRSEDHSGADERDEKFGGLSMDNNSGMGSQLREILQQHSGPGSSSDRRCGGYSSGLSSNNSSSGDDNNNSSRLYKFKSNMKHRFSADLEQSHQVRKKRRDSESSCGNYTDCEKDRVTPTGPMSLSRPTSCQEGFPHDTGKLLDGRDSPLLEKNQRCQTPTPKCENKGGRSSPCRQSGDAGSGPTVPIFALNQSGNFYVPLTINSSLIAPAMSGLSDLSPVLHPISISVNFCGSTPTITSNAVTPNQAHGAGNLVSNSYLALGSRLSQASQNSTMNSFESGTYNGRPYTRVVGDRKRREPSRQVSQFEDQRTGLSNTSDSIEKREPSDLEMRELRDVREHHHRHSDHQQRDLPRDPSSWMEQMLETKDSKDQKTHEVRDVQNVRNLRDIHEVREMWDIRDPAQTVREFIDRSCNYPNNTAYARTHSHWAAAYHNQSKN
ncbi:transcription factor cwo-like isoform X1 [Homarus americanus]|uniref:transcription factor cwo-like isoform X1 n=1 Tax=Homarus americanus TaxID=6706 RepID=UPI001C4861CB|nr:transcription factor cwo-like isoform X1 [Homarus americanus]